MNIDDENKEIDLKDDEKPLKDEEIIIEHDENENTPEENQEKSAKSPEIPVELGLDELKRQLDDEKKAREKAETEARDARQEANRHKSELDDTNLLLLNNAVKEVQRQIDESKARMKAALESGDYDAVPDLQEEIARNTGKLEKLETGKNQYEARIKSTPREADVVERFCSQLTKPSADWIRKHPQFVTDPRLNQKMIAAHNLALADGIQADTPEYFSSIEETLRLRKEERVEKREIRTQVESDEEGDAMSSAAKPVSGRKPAAPPAAPPSRSAPNGAGRPNVVRLTREEREMASMMGLSDVEYAKNKLSLIREGKMAK